MVASWNTGSRFFLLVGAMMASSLPWRWRHSSLFCVTCTPQRLSFLMLVNDAVERGLIVSLDANDGENSEIKKQIVRIILMGCLLVN